MCPKGFFFSGVRCGLKNKRNDLGVILSDRPAVAAGVFTTNQVRAACVDHSRRTIEGGSLRAIVVNSGNANCCTGTQGERDTQAMATQTAQGLNIDPNEVAVASTGVIGHLLDMAKVERGIADATSHLATDIAPFVDAILTTDLVEKWANLSLDGNGQPIGLATPGNDHHFPTENAEASILGIAKGSGMIAPNMATMLGFVTTDLDVTGIDLAAMLKRVADQSFNCMTVDGDTSTNDMLIVMANGASGVRPTADQMEAALTSVCVSLAKQIARDGEGATKLIEVHVVGTSDPRKIARTIGESPLVKTAMFGCDPNWGRMLMAAGRAGVPFSPQEARLSLVIDGEEYVLFEEGGPAPFDPKRVSTALKADYVVIELRIGHENSEATVYTCDFGYGYVRINAEYHT